MRVLATVRYAPGVSRSDVRDLIVPEERASWEAYLDGFVREIFVAGEELHTDARTVVVAILEAEGVDDARDRMAEFPMVREGYVSVEYVELEPFAYWEQLFEPAERIHLDGDERDD
jgi:hypothetical protein